MVLKGPILDKLIILSNRHMTDTPHTLWQAARSFFSGTLLSRITGLGRDIAMASTFGTNPLVAAFFVAFRLAHLLRRILGEGALQSVFIPHFERLKSNDSVGAARFFVDLYATITVILLLCITLGIACCQFLHSHVTTTNGDIVDFSQIMLPSVLFICLFGINASLLQCEKFYFLPSVAPVAFNLIWIASTLSMGGIEIKNALMWLSLAITVACLGQWLVTLPKSLSLLCTMHAGKIPWKHVRPFSSEVIALIPPLLLGVIGIAATQINSALDLFFARYADLEGPAYLWFAIRIEQLPLALFGIALSSALLPPLTRSLREKAYDKYLQLLRYALEQASKMMLPMSVALILLGESAIGAVYGSGHFNGTSTTETALCLYGYAIGLIPQALVLLIAPAFYSQMDYRTPAKGTLTSICLNVCLNAFMVFGLQAGAPSIAIATSLSAWANLLYLAVRLDSMTTNVRLSSSLWQAIGKGLAQAAPGTSLIALATYAIDSYMSEAAPLLHLAMLALPFTFYFGGLYALPLMRKQRLAFTES
jgi:putative peptidoglycan lipid II flippase